MDYMSMALVYSMVGYMLLDRILGPNLNNTQGTGSNANAKNPNRLAAQWTPSF